ncbi:hypothetical protein OA542_00955 [Opitutae bacterium]|nr:hypothetical protein [Opitutae bacterium]
MKKIIIFYLLTSSVNLFALDIISINFHNLDDDGSWAYDTQTIKKNERAGTSDYSGGSTITNKWNNILPEALGNISLVDSSGSTVDLDIKIKAISPTWNNAYKNQPGMVGISAWPKMIIKEAISISGLNNYSQNYVVVLFLSYQKDSGFTAGELNIAGNKIPFTKENEVIICENLVDDALMIDLANKSSGVNKGGVFIGGMQIIKR